MLVETIKATYVKIISLLLVFILAVSIVFAAFSGILYASSAQPIEVQSPDAAWFGQPFKVEIIINDPVIRQHTNMIEIGGDYPPLASAEISGAQLLYPDDRYLKYEGAEKISILFPGGYYFVEKATSASLTLDFRWYDFLGTYKSGEEPKSWNMRHFNYKEGTADYYLFKHQLAYVVRTFTILPVELEYRPPRSGWEISRLTVPDPWKGKAYLLYLKAFDPDYKEVDGEEVTFEAALAGVITPSRIDELVAEYYSLKVVERPEETPWSKTSVTTTAADSDILSYFGLTYGKKIMVEKASNFVTKREYDESVRKFRVVVKPSYVLKVYLAAYGNGKFISFIYERRGTIQQEFMLYEDEDAKNYSVYSEIKRLSQQAIDNAWAEGKEFIKSFRVKPKQVQAPLATTDLRINTREYTKLAPQTTTTTTTIITTTTTNTTTKPLKYTLSLSKTSITVYNNGVFNTGTPRDSDFLILVNVKAEGGDPNIDPYKLVYVVGRILEGEKAPIGFQVEGSATLTPTLKVKPRDELVTFHVMTKGPRGPNKGLAFNPVQKIEFQAVNATTEAPVSNKVVFTANLLEAAPTIVIKPSDPDQIQEGTQRTFKLKVIDPDGKDKVKVTLSVAHGYGLVKVSGSEWLERIQLTLNPGEEITVAYEAPKVGNFNLPEEINGLSMWALQKKTLKTLAKDTVGLGLKWKVESLEKARKTSQAVVNNKNILGGDIENIYAAINGFDKTYAAWKTTQTAYKGYRYIERATGTYYRATEELPQQFEVASRDNGKTTLEKVADWGIVGITMAQTAVGAVTLVTDKVPVIGSVGGEFRASFNAMTNVWKGNLQYISQVEKINRAEERYIPVIIKITAVDDTGFEVSDAKIYFIVYYWV